MIDFYVNHSNLRLADDQPKRKGDVRIVADVQSTGTHTGKPFAFGPFPEIQAAGTKVFNEPERMTFLVRPCKDSGELKIMRMEIEPIGNDNGYATIYEKIGGVVF